MQVSKWGSSLAVRLPKALVRQMKLKAGDELQVVDAAGRELRLAKVDDRKAAVQALAAMQISLPNDYRFDRDDANAR